MGATNNSQLRDLVYKTLGFSETAAQETIAERALGLTRTVEVFYKTAVDAMASDTTLLWALPVTNNIEVTAVTVMPYGALTANDTNFATVSLEYDDGAGGSDTLIASRTTVVANGNWVAGTAFNLTLSATPANLRVSGASATQYLIFKIAKTASGVAVPACKMFVTFKLV